MTKNDLVVLRRSRSNKLLLVFGHNSQLIDSPSKKEGIPFRFMDNNKKENKKSFPRLQKRRYPPTPDSSTCHKVPKTLFSYNFFPSFNSSSFLDFFPTKNVLFSSLSKNILEYLKIISKN